MPGTMTCLLYPKIRPELLEWVLSERLGGGVRHASWNPYPISDQNLWFSLPYFRPEALEPGAWPEFVTSCYGMYTVVGVNFKREMVLSPNDEEVANSSQKHIQFKTRVHKPYPISHQNSFKKTYRLSTCLYSLYKGLPPRVKNPLQIISLAANVIETNY